MTRKNVCLNVSSAFNFTYLIDMKKTIFILIGTAVSAITTLLLIGDCSNNSSSPTQIPHTIFDRDSSAEQLTLRIVIPKRMSKDSLIEISRQLKEERHWKGDLVCSFYIKVPFKGTPWATTTYSSNFPEYGNSKDKEDNAIDFKQIGISQSLADSLSLLKSDTLSENKQLASFIHDAFQCKSVILETPIANKYLMVDLLMDGSRINHPLEMRTVNGKERLYISDFEENAYITIEQNDGTVTFHAEYGMPFETMPTL